MSKYIVTKVKRNPTEQEKIVANLISEKNSYDSIIKNLNTGKWASVRGGSDGKESACSAGALGGEDPLEKGVATHSSVLTWKILWTEKPGGLQSMGSQRVGDN